MAARVLSVLLLTLLLPASRASGPLQATVGTVSIQIQAATAADSTMQFSGPPIVMTVTIQAEYGDPPTLVSVTGDVTVTSGQMTRTQAAAAIAADLIDELGADRVTQTKERIMVKKATSPGTPSNPVYSPALDPNKPYSQTWKE